MKKVFFSCLLVCSFATVTTSCQQDDRLAEQEIKEETTTVAKIDLDQIIAQNPNVNQIKIIGEDGNFNIITNNNDGTSSKATTSYTLGYTKDIIVTRVTKFAIQNKTARITVNAEHKPKGTFDCEALPFLLPTVQKVGWNNNNISVLQTVQVSSSRNYLIDAGSNGCVNQSKPIQKRGTLNQYDALSYQEVGWKIKNDVSVYNIKFQVIIDFL